MAVKYGTAQHPYQVRIPGWDDFVHVYAGPAPTKEDWRAYYGNKDDPARQDELIGGLKAEYMRDRVETAEALRASPLPEVAQAWNWWVGAIDEAQDYLFLAQAATAGLALVAPQVGLPLLGFEAGLDAALDVASYPLRATAAARKRLQIDAARRARGGDAMTRLSAEGADALRQIRGPWSVLDGLQALDTLTGVGTSIGQAFFLVEDIVFASYRAMRGEHVVVQKQEGEAWYQTAGRVVLNAYWAWLAGDGLPMRDHLFLAIAAAHATQALGAFARERDLVGRLNEAMDWPMPRTRFVDEGTREFFRQVGADPDAPMRAPIDALGSAPTVRQVLAYAPARTPAMTREFSARWGREPLAELHGTLRTSIADSTIGALTGQEQTWSPAWSEEEGFLLSMLERQPYPDVVHPAAQWCGLDSAIAWWRANRSTLRIYGLGPDQVARAAETVSRAYTEALIPEVQRAGGCPLTWLRHGHVGAQGQPSGPIRLLRVTTAEWGFNTLQVQRTDGRGGAVIVEPTTEAGLDWLTADEIATAVLRGDLARRARAATPVQYMTFMPAPPEVPCWGDPVPRPQLPIAPPSREWNPAPQSDLDVFFLTDQNWGRYGATHREGWEQGGLAANPILNMPWGTRFTWRRNIERLRGSWDETTTVTAYYRALAQQPDAIVQLLWEDGWDPWWLTWGQHVMPRRRYVGIHWGEGYTAQRWVLRQPLEPAMRAQWAADYFLRDFCVGWMGSLAATVAWFVWLHWWPYSTPRSYLNVPYGTQPSIAQLTFGAQRVIREWEEMQAQEWPIFRPDQALHNGPPYGLEVQTT